MAIYLFERYVIYYTSNTILLSFVANIIICYYSNGGRSNWVILSFFLYLLFPRYIAGSANNCQEINICVPFRNICVTNDQRYVPFVVITTRSFIHDVLFYWVCKKSKTTGATRGAENSNSSGAPESAPVFYFS